MLSIKKDNKEKIDTIVQKCRILIVVKEEEKYITSAQIILEENNENLTYYFYTFRIIILNIRM